ncbi:MAG: hypothetical protein DMD29_04190 [Gemmatimonadetes bacterium]|nr:MAG: hypothetical protein DMD29_04190 [Gemmatimonadota bacterium]
MDTVRIKRYWGTQRVARVCQVTPGTVANWIDQGLLKGHRTPTGRRRVASADLADFLRAHGMAVPADLAQAEAQREKIVVVDDEPAYLKALMKFIERSDLGVDAVAVANGMDALLEIGKLRPAVVVLDYRLPDMNADQVVERLLEPGGRGLGAEVVVVTGGIPPEAEQRLRRVGVRTVVQKVDGLDVVVDAIRQALRQRRRAA